MQPLLSAQSVGLHLDPKLAFAADVEAIDPDSLSDVYFCPSCDGLKLMGFRRQPITLLPCGHTVCLTCITAATEPSCPCCHSTVSNLMLSKHHLQLIRRVVVSCPFKARPGMPCCCEWRGTLTSLSLHLHSCSNILTKCPECKDTILIQRGVEHDCPKARKPCVHCQASIPSDLMPTHLTHCPERPTACPACMETQEPGERHICVQAQGRCHVCLQCLPSPLDLASHVKQSPGVHLVKAMARMPGGTCSSQTIQHVLKDGEKTLNALLSRLDLKQNIRHTEEVANARLRRANVMLSRLTPVATLDPVATTFTIVPPAHPVGRPTLVRVRVVARASLGGEVTTPMLWALYKTLGLAVRTETGAILPGGLSTSIVSHPPAEVAGEEHTMSVDIPVTAPFPGTFQLRAVSEYAPEVAAQAPPVTFRSDMFTFRPSPGVQLSLQNRAASFEFPEDEAKAIAYKLQAQPTVSAQTAVLNSLQPRIMPIGIALHPPDPSSQDQAARAGGRPPPVYIRIRVLSSTGRFGLGLIGAGNGLMPGPVKQKHIFAVLNNGTVRKGANKPSSASIFSTIGGDAGVMGKGHVMDMWVEWNSWPRNSTVSVRLNDRETQTKVFVLNRTQVSKGMWFGAVVYGNLKLVLEDLPPHMPRPWTYS